MSTGRWGGSGSYRRSSTRDQEEESPTMLKRKEIGEEEWGEEEGKEEGEEDNVLLEQEVEDEEDEQGAGEREGDFASKQEEA